MRDEPLRDCFAAIQAELAAVRNARAVAEKFVALDLETDDARAVLSDLRAACLRWYEAKEKTDAAHRRVRASAPPA